MPITDIAVYAHLSGADIEGLGSELDAIRRGVEDSRGANDAAYIRRTITFQRTLDVVARLLIGGSRSKAGWMFGTASLAFAKRDDDLGFGVMRVTRDQPWQPLHLLQPLAEPVVGDHLRMGHRPARRAGSERLGRQRPPKGAAQARALIGKIARQVVKDYVLYPALSRSRWRRTLAADAAANLLRQPLWAYMVIFCAHFPGRRRRFAARLRPR